MKNLSIHSKNQELELTIDGLSHDGLGVARSQGVTVFVHDALPGESVQARIIKVSSKYSVARVQLRTTDSEQRQEPFCPVYRKCGGCSVQHMRYAETLRFKRQLIADSLERIGGFKGVSVKPVIGMDHPFKYRNKAQYPVGTEGGRAVAGFYARRSHDIVDASECGIQHPSSEKTRASVLAWINKHRVPVYDEIADSGLIRHIVVRVGTNTGEVLAMIVATRKHLPHAEDLVKRLRKEVPGLVGIVLNVNASKSNIILGEENYILYGSPIFEDAINGMRFEISPNSFFQVNSEQTAVLYRLVESAAQLSGTETVFDLYCGIGTIGLSVARKAALVVGVEVQEEAVETATINAAKNRMNNVKFYSGSAEVVVPKLFAEGMSADVVIVDPPRKGCETALLETILEMKPKRIIYVSCSPATLARDLKFLCSGDKASEATNDVYEISSVQPVDMFPWTEHVETVVLLSHKKSQASSPSL